MMNRADNPLMERLAWCEGYLTSMRDRNNLDDASTLDLNVVLAEIKATLDDWIENKTKPEASMGTTNIEKENERRGNIRNGSNAPDGAERDQHRTE